MIYDIAVVGATTLLATIAATLAADLVLTERRGSRCEVVAILIALLLTLAVLANMLGR